MKMTCQEKYGTDYAWQAEQTKVKIKQTTREHYGVNYYLQTPECRAIIAKQSASEEIKNKIRQSCMDHYGVEYSWQAKEVKDKIKQTLLRKYGVTNAEHLNKSNNFAKYGVRSSYEKKLKDALIYNNIKFLYEYEDSRYPYLCDFYLPDNDLFVEINGYWTHGGHWFNPNDSNDIKTLKALYEKTKQSSMYQSMVIEWTKSDVEKRNCAKNNKLNYVVLWSMADIQDWINSNFEIRHDY